MIVEGLSLFWKMMKPFLKSSCRWSWVPVLLAGLPVDGVSGLFFSHLLQVFSSGSKGWMVLLFSTRLLSSGWWPSLKLVNSCAVYPITLSLHLLPRHHLPNLFSSISTFLRSFTNPTRLFQCWLCFKCCVIFILWVMITTLATRLE